MSWIAVIWDSMLDKYIYGSSDRKNPESPMPLLDVESEETKLWWASNVANNIASLNGWVDLITTIGNDQNGEIFKKLCEDNKINLQAVFSDNPTTTKIRFIDSQFKQQLLRVDYEKKNKILASNIQEIIKILQNNKPEYIIISDYNKGVIDKELVDLIKDLSQEQWSKILVDTKPQNVDLFTWVYLIKPNFKEFCEMIWQKIDKTDEEIEKYGKLFVEKYQTNLVVTKWSQWATLITLQWNAFHIKATEEHKVFDVSWAGDTFIATICYALDHGYTLENAVILANKASGIVVEKVGTAKVTKEELWLST